MKKTINRKIFFTIITAIAVSGFIVICTLAQSVRNTKIQTRFAANVPEVVQPECTVREYNGKIGVFRGSGDKPYKVIDYDVNLNCAQQTLNNNRRRRKTRFRILSHSNRACPFPS